MKPSLLPLAVTTLMLAFSLTFAVQTATAAGYNAGNYNAPAPREPDTRVLIESVDASAKTVVFKYMDKGTTQTYTVDDLTTIKVNDNTGTFAQIKSGMQVRDSVERDSQTLDSISVSTADPAPAGATGPTKQKKQKSSSSSSSDSSSSDSSN
jgi:hypothetical protein